MSRPTRAEAPSRPITIRVSQAERDRLQQAAQANHQNLSQYSRDVLMDDAEAYFEKRRNHP